FEDVLGVGERQPGTRQSTGAILASCLEILVHGLEGGDHVLIATERVVLGGVGDLWRIGFLGHVGLRNRAAGRGLPRVVGGGSCGLALLVTGRGTAQQEGGQEERVFHGWYS